MPQIRNYRRALESRSTIHAKTSPVSIRCQVKSLHVLIPMSFQHPRSSRLHPRPTRWMNEHRGSRNESYSPEPPALSERARVSNAPFWTRSKVQVLKILQMEKPPHQIPDYQGTPHPSNDYRGQRQDVVQWHHLHMATNRHRRWQYL